MRAMRKTHYRSTELFDVPVLLSTFPSPQLRAPDRMDSRDSDENHIRSVSLWLCVEA
jgi:hypothetical protein